MFTRTCVLGLKHSVRHALHTHTRRSPRLENLQIWSRSSGQCSTGHSDPDLGSIASQKIPFKNDFPSLTAVSTVYQCGSRKLKTIKGTASSLTIKSYGAKISQ